jgi:hypothetical protein
LPTDLTVRIVGTTWAPNAAEAAQRDLASVGIPSTVSLADGPPSPQVLVSAPRPLRPAAVAIARVVPGARVGVDLDHSSTVVLVVGATWPGLLSTTTTSSSSTTTTTTRPVPATTTTLANRGTDEHVSCR